MSMEIKVHRQDAIKFLEEALRNAPKVVLNADAIDDTADALEAFVRERTQGQAKAKAFKA